MALMSRPNKFNLNALHMVCENYSGTDLKDVIKLLVDKGIVVKATCNSGRNALHKLCMNYKGDDIVDVIIFFLDQGLDINSQAEKRKNRDGMNVLICLMCYNDRPDLVQIIRFLVDEKDLDVHSAINNGSNILYHFLSCDRNERDKNLLHRMAIVKEIISTYPEINVNAKTTNEDQDLYSRLLRYEGEDLLECVNYFVYELHIEVDIETLAAIEHKQGRINKRMDKL